MKQAELLYLWETLPIGRENAISYSELCAMWNVNKRTARRYMQLLSEMDNGDEFVLIRSGNTRGFYRSNDAAEIKAYKYEMLHKGRSIIAAVRKCERVLGESYGQQMQMADLLK